MHVFATAAMHNLTWSVCIYIVCSYMYTSAAAVTCTFRGRVPVHGSVKSAALMCTHKQVLACAVLSIEDCAMISKFNSPHCSMVLCIHMEAYIHV